MNSKYIKTKQNRKLEAKFFELFRVLHLVGKQAYKLELPKKERIHDIFYVSLLEQDTNRKAQVDKNLTEFEASNNKKYKVERIWDSTFYAKKSAACHLPGLYYLISWKGYPKEENTWEPTLAIQHLRKLLSAFYKDNPNKSMATSLLVDTTALMAWHCSKPTKDIKQKRNWAVTSTQNKKAKIL